MHDPKLLWLDAQVVSPRAHASSAAVHSQQDQPREGCEASKEDGQKDGLEPWSGNLTGIAIDASCSVCMNRPVQVRSPGWLPPQIACIHLDALAPHLAGRLVSQACHALHS